MFKIPSLIKFAIASSLMFFCFANWNSRVFASDITQTNVLQLINDQRIKNGLEPLKENLELDQAATLKTKDMLNRSYFEHYAHGMTPWDFINMSGYNYLYAGENLAMDFNSSEGMVSAWMNSPTHRQNILSPDYNDVGIGIVKGAYTENGTRHETVMVTNMFGRKKPTIIKWFDFIALKISNLL